MDQTFRGSEIVQFAIEIEKNGKAFYESVAENAKNNTVKEGFKWLAGEEVKHKETFEKILEGLAQHPQPESYPGEYYDYMKALVDENVFTKSDALKNLVEKPVTTAQALKLALGFEKDSILFFTELKKYVPESAQEIMDSLIEEEKKHINNIMSLKKKVE